MSLSLKIYFVLIFRVFLMLGVPASGAIALKPKLASVGIERSLPGPLKSPYVYLEQSAPNRCRGSSYRKRRNYEPTGALQ